MSDHSSSWTTPVDALRHRRRTIPLTTVDKAIFQCASARQEREYRRTDTDDAEIARLRMSRGGIVACVSAGLSRSEEAPHDQT